MWTVYVLKLRHDRYYVGSTRRSVETRIEEHRHGHAAAWTRRHPVVSCVRAYTVSTDPGLEEDKVTLQYLRRYGPDSTRGGKYSQLALSRQQLAEIQRSLRHNDGLCTRCGRRGHFVSQCYARRDAGGCPIDDSSSESSDESVYESSSDDDYN